MKKVLVCLLVLVAVGCSSDDHPSLEWHIATQPTSQEAIEACQAMVGNPDIVNARWLVAGERVVGERSDIPHQEFQTTGIDVRPNRPFSASIKVPEGTNYHLHIRSSCTNVCYDTMVLFAGGVDVSEVFCGRDVVVYGFAGRPAATTVSGAVE